MYYSLPAFFMSPKGKSSRGLRRTRQNLHNDDLLLKPEIDPDVSLLCEQCSKVPLNYSELSKVSGRRGDKYTWSLGTFGEVRARSCPLCQLVESACSVAKSWEPPAKPNDSQRVWLQWDKDRRWFMVVGLSPIGTFICFAKADHVSLVKSTRTLGEWIDPKLCKRWLSVCREQHGHDYSHFVFDKQKLRTDDGGPPLTLRLVDVGAMCLVDAPEACQYVALSYVWGNPADGRLVLNRSNKSKLTEPHSLRNRFNSIPSTITSAMKLIGDLGERYLWVDSLCLVQDDEEELRKCSEIMDAFYAMATFTIVAASGTDAWDGLPGVFLTPRKDARLVNEILPGVWMTTVNDIDRFLRVSHYFSRGWT